MVWQQSYITISSIKRIKFVKKTASSTLLSLFSIGFITHKNNCLWKLHYIKGNNYFTLYIDKLLICSIILQRKAPLPH